MKETLFCHLCDEQTEFYIADETFNYPVKNEHFTIKGKRAYCEIHHEELFHKEYDRANQQTAFNLYREANGLVTVDEIKETREKYKLTQREYSHLLGFGEITISRYERGSLPTKVQSQLIEESRRPERMKKLLEENKGEINHEKAEQLLDILNGSQMEKKYEEIIFKEIRDVFQHMPTIFTGQMPFSFEKFGSMATFFADKEKPFITKLNKLMFYADFFHFRLYNSSISGATYNRLQYGPVPVRYNTLYESIPSIEMVEDGYGIKAIAIQDLEESSLTEEEAAVLKFVSERFSTMNASQIADYSHQEKCWIEVGHSEKIPYSYAGTLKFEK
ncbi:type II TA system antitoxin MqsA family protein [Sporosarcina limicola]|uniref:Zinc finger/helix-turn-helix YgiT family protein n=1 Tax=Sporosarcina limicola TaxID=34101 RepID=A0A927MEM0_9BACL|nr:type II TA system antitoxin MqsA family protein [Sporosarcina limicola]MBE1553223.1 putative zinc finger/helix-turn-helix YgiT family protein [Sporosarcina limicola]